MRKKKERREKKRFAWGEKGKKSAWGDLKRFYNLKAIPFLEGEERGE